MGMRKSVKEHFWRATIETRTAVMCVIDRAAAFQASQLDFIWEDDVELWEMDALSDIFESLGVEEE